MVLESRPIEVRGPTRPRRKVPRCSEGVTFYILKTPANLSKAQVLEFPFQLNARPVQPLNGRKIVAN